MVKIRVAVINSEGNTAPPFPSPSPLHNGFKREERNSVRPECFQGPTKDFWIISLYSEVRFGEPVKHENGNPVPHQGPEDRSPDTTDRRSREQALDPGPSHRPCPGSRFIGHSMEPS